MFRIFDLMPAVPVGAVAVPVAPSSPALLPAVLNVGFAEKCREVALPSKWRVRKTRLVWKAAVDVKQRQSNKSLATVSGEGAILLEGVACSLASKRFDYAYGLVSQIINSQTVQCHLDPLPHLISADQRKRGYIGSSWELVRTPSPVPLHELFTLPIISSLPHIAVCLVFGIF